MVMPGGQIIGGMGGSILVGVQGGTDPTHTIEVAQWQVTRQWLNAECTHSGTAGAVARRCVAHDWSFSCSLPNDQSNPADRILGYLPIIDPSSYVSVSISFRLGDVKTNPEAAAMGMQQKAYYAPSALIRVAQTVLDASRDVIRIQCAGEGNSRLFLLPDEEADCAAYMKYLKDRGWRY